jgi:hypothetical protein
LFPTLAFRLVTFPLLVYFGVRHGDVCQRTLMWYITVRKFVPQGDQKMKKNFTSIL